MIKKVTGWSSDAPSTPPTTEVRQPGIATAAAVLAFVEAGLALAFVVYALAQTANSGVGGEPALAALVLLGTTALSALHLVGGLSLVRGRGRRLLLGATIAELVAVVAIGVWVLWRSPTPTTPTATTTRSGPRSPRHS